MSNVILSMSNISKSYKNSGLEKLMVLQSVNLTVATGDLIGLTAPSGAGKSTLLHICGLLDTCDSGKFNFLGQNITIIVLLFQWFSYYSSCYVHTTMMCLC